MRSFKLAFGIILLTMFSCFSVAGENADAVWIDVRSEAEYKQDNMPDSTLIAHTEIADKIADLNLEKSTPIKLFCRSGGRAGQAKKSLEALGYTNVENVGGLDDARKARAKLEGK